ncbi:ATP-binding protein [Exilibacterium tricleocarpae]|uniref:ATP-binding protein n=2 Tax=Exilibacterium tricleocarpae TaxID=2591008 RepID=A0A545TZT4_9GAMM|nr:ATP-binding protein [Exilibacterium tricleocarpae]
MDNNDQHLAATVNWVRLRLQQLARSSSAGVKKEKKTSNSWFSRSKKYENKMLPAPPAERARENVEQARLEMTKFEEQNPPPALNLLAQRLGLSTFDCSVLALCAAVELDTRVAGLCAEAQGDVNKPYPTFALAFVLFEDAGWNALSPHAPLRYWRLLEIHQPGTLPLTSASLCADERIVNYLKGLNYLDDRLTPLLDPITVEPETLPPSQQRTIDAIVENLQLGSAGTPFIELLGNNSASKRLIAAHASVQLGLSLQSTHIKSLPNQVGDLETFLRLWERESLLMPLALYIVVDGAGEQEKAQLNHFLDRTSGVVFVDLDGGNLEALRNRFSVEINKPTPEEQQQLWLQFLQDHAGGYAQRLSEQFSFSQNEIKHLASTVLEKLETADGTESIPSPNLWQACRAAARVGMEQLAQRIEAKAQWEQLVLPAEQKALLRQITDQVAQRNCVYEDWGFRGQMNRGLGISALFAGESGTGKTMAAEVIANALELDLYRIDLSAVVNKYIGETEKNLRKLFDAAEDSGAILFFDEADALFGKRSEVKDSHDRYANIEVNYLLQRMESYRGLAILATNMKASLDKAFMRRLRFIVDFPFPGMEERTEIWKKVFPPATPVDENFDCRRLAKLSLNGGNIHNVALNAAFMAAQKGCVVTMPLVLNAARIEYRKLERPAKESDFTLPSSLEVVK